MSTRPVLLSNRFGYQGQWFDNKTGLVDMRARFYRPSWGRFVSPDPIGLAGGPNAFAFAAGAPTSWWDPIGLNNAAFNDPPPDAGPVEKPVDLDKVCAVASDSCHGMSLPPVSGGLTENGAVAPPPGLADTAMIAVN